MEDERRGGWVLRAVTTFYCYRYGEHVTIVMLSIGISGAPTKYAKISDTG
jgi:hypothetical protein